MDTGTVALVLLGGFAVFFLLGVPIAISLGIATVATLYLLGIPTMELVQGAMIASDSFPFLAVPFFVMAGALMDTGGLSKRLIGVASALMGHVTGGLAHVTIIACAFFAAISGSGPATTAAIGALMIPAMLNREYSREFAGAVSSSGGTLGILIPPSIPMVVYGIVGNVSVTDLFLAGIIPGILVSGAFIVTAYLVSKRNGYVGSGQPFSWSGLGKALNEAKAALVAPLIILGGIYGGIFTATEAAVVAVAYGLFCGFFIYKELKISDLPRIFIETAMITGSVMIIIGFATAFGRLMTMYQIPQMIATWMQSVTTSQFILLMMINVFLLFVGMFMETIAQIIILTPLFMPIALKLGIDPIQLGIIFVINCELGFLTPPVGANLFIAANLAKTSIEKLSRAVLPFLLALFLSVAILSYFPEISTWLPKYIKSLR
jgi:C4-dicarboxylate transporter DctM subunit